MALSLLRTKRPKKYIRKAQQQCLRPEIYNLLLKVINWL